MIASQTILDTTGLSPTDPKQNKFTCICCRVKFETADLQRAHFKSEWHSYNLKRKVCSLEPIDQDSFEEIRGKRPAQQETSKQSEDEADNDDDWESVDDEELLDEDYDEEEAAEMLARVIKSNHCLFCDKKSYDIKKNVDHMNLMHGFFVPEEQYLIDLEDLMEYLGFKVGAGATCLWCQKQFATVQGVRLHMLYKDHCKIMYDHDKALDEFKEFYDYSSQEHIEMKPIRSLVISKRAERRAEHSKALAKANEARFNQRQLVAKKNEALEVSRKAKGIKKFQAYRAKIILRTGMANNQTMRGRLRQQNPI